MWPGSGVRGGGCAQPGGCGVRAAKAMGGPGQCPSLCSFALSHADLWLPKSSTHSGVPAQSSMAARYVLSGKESMLWAGPGQAHGCRRAGLGCPSCVGVTVVTGGSVLGHVFTVTTLFPVFY